MEPRHPEGAEIQADGAEGAEIRPQAQLRATPKGLVTLSSLLRHKGRRQLQVDDADGPRRPMFSGSCSSGTSESLPDAIVRLVTRQAALPEAVL